MKQAKVFVTLNKHMSSYIVNATAQVGTPSDTITIMVHHVYESTDDTEQNNQSNAIASACMILQTQLDTMGWECNGVSVSIEGALVTEAPDKSDI